MSKENKKFLIYIIISLLLSSCIYGISVSCFINSPGSDLLPAGISGLAMITSRYIIRAENTSLFYAIVYILINFPLFILAYKHIGKLFSLITAANVVLASTIIALVPYRLWEFVEVTSMPMLDISLFAGFLTGVSIGLALKANLSTGGTDILALYFSIKKGKSIGKYIMLLNCFVVLLGGILSKNIHSMLYTMVYIGTSSIVIDSIYKRTKKTKLEVVSERGEEISQTLLKDTGHGVTIVDAIGAYSHQNKKVLHMVISVRQVKHVVDIIRRIDPNSFVVELPVEEVYGRFYLPSFK